jgi:hypothetical protein
MAIRHLIFEGPGGKFEPMTPPLAGGKTACRRSRPSARFPVLGKPLVPLCVVIGFLSPGAGKADVPLPARLMQPAHAAEAWNVIRLAMNNAERLFSENRIDEVKEPVVLLGPALGLLGREGAVSGRQREAEALAAGAFQRVNLLVREAMAGNLDGGRTLFNRLREDVEQLAGPFAPELPSIEILSCVDHPEVAERTAGLKCPECGNRLHPRRFPYSAVYTRNDDPVLRLEAKGPPMIEAGKPVPLGIRLTADDGEPVGREDLVLSHARRVHLLLVDESGEDFQHLAPEPGNEPGTFTAPFLPGRSAGYRGWVLAVPAVTRLPEVLPLRLGTEGPGPPPVPPEAGNEDCFSAERNGFVVRVTSSGSGPLRIRAARTQTIRVHVARNDGSPFDQLEPFWNAFAHLTLVSWNLESAVQVHPVGGEILRDSLRGGPDLTFKLHAPGPGWWRLYLHVRCQGQTITFPLRFMAVDS